MNVVTRDLCIASRLDCVQAIILFFLIIHKFLTKYHNFGFVQIESSCRRQNKCLSNFEKSSLERIRKHCEKKEKELVTEVVFKKISI